MGYRLCQVLLENSVILYLSLAFSVCYLRFPIIAIIIIVIIIICLFVVVVRTLFNLLRPLVQSLTAA